MKRITFVSTIISISIACFIVIILSGEHCDECFSAPVLAVKFFICGWIIIIGTIYFTTKFLKTEGVIFDVESQPILETHDAVDGVPFAGEGIIESDKVIESPYTKTPCVYFHSIKEAYVREGKHSRWKIIENMSLFIPFYLKDETGKLKIDLTNFDDDFSNYKIPSLNTNIPNPKNSEVDCDALLKKSTYIEKRPAILGFFTTNDKYRVSEFVLKPDTKVFAHGMVSKKDGELVLREDENYPLIISKKSRDQYVEEFYKGTNLVYLSHLLIAFGYTVVLFSLNYSLKFDAFGLMAALLIGNSIIAGSVIFSAYNRIIILKHRALNALSNIDVELKRRADLIPNIVEAVKDYAKYEKEVHQIVAEARAKVVFSEKLTAEEKPIIPSLAAIIENYPELKASANFLSLMDVLVDTEERIAYSREFYNRSVRKFNTLIEQFPFLLISFFLNIRKMYFISIGRGKKAILETGA